MPSASILLQLLLVAPRLHGAITGTVRAADTARPIAGVTVDLATRGRSAVTDSTGQYDFAGLEVGAVPLTFRRIGYATWTVTALVPAEGMVEIDVALAAEPVVLPPVLVPPPIASRDQIDRAAPTADRWVDARDLAFDPRLAEADPLAATAGPEISLAPEAPDGLHLRGASGDEVAYLLDGIPVFNPVHSAGLFSAWNPDALDGVEVASGTPPLGTATGLAGAISARTRTPGDRVGWRGGVTPDQARLTVDAPARNGVDLLVSGRAGFPGLLGRKGQPSYLRGRSGDWVVRLQLPVLGGVARLLGYWNDNTLVSNRLAPTPGTPSNRFTWAARSLGLTWQRDLRAGTLELHTWAASADAGGRWSTGAGMLDLGSHRIDPGFRFQVVHAGRVTARVGIAAERIRSRYLVETDSGGGTDLGGGLAVVTPFAGVRFALGPRFTSDFGVDGSLSRGRVYPGTRARLEWRPTTATRLFAAWFGTPQFFQSLRNPESPVSLIFPVELSVIAGVAIPVATSHQVLLGAEYTVSAGVHVRGSAFHRMTHGRVLVAPIDPSPFTTGNFAAGGERADGVGVELEVHRPVWSGVLSYLGQRVRLGDGRAAYQPGYAPSHEVRGGVMVRPWRNSAIRLGFTALAGRRSTLITGRFEWESCNLIDRGCEFTGDRISLAGPPGSVRLPSYLAMDFGVRQEFTIGSGAHLTRVGLFTTVSNLFNRDNLLAYLDDQGVPRPITFRPRAPVVIGLDWQL